jgi:multiple sugar transport system permease protein
VKAATILMGLVFISPVLFTLVLSLNFEGVFPTLRQYGELLITNFTFLNHFWYSVFYSLIITIVCIILSFPLGFLFAKLQFPFKNSIFLLFIIAMLLPFQATVLPQYIQLRDFGLLGTPVALIIPAVFSPFAVFLFCQFIKQVPTDVLEYTTLVTSSPIRILWHAVLPQVRPAVFALSVMVFCESWNMMEPVIFFAIRNPGIHPLSVRLGDLPEPVAFSAATVYMVPVLFLFLLFKEALAESMGRFRWG